MWILPLSTPVFAATTAACPKTVAFDLARADRVGFIPATSTGTEESPPVGPDLLTISPNGVIAFLDPVNKVAVIDPFGSMHTFPVGIVQSLAFAGPNLLAQSERDRNVRAYDTTNGTQIQTFRIPDLIPPGSVIRVDGREVWAEDVFGNLHPVANVENGTLSAATDGTLAPPRHPISVANNATETTVRVGDYPPITVPGRASARVIGFNHPWIVVDRIDEVEGTIRARRFVGEAGTTNLTEIEIAPPPYDYIPSEGFAVDESGRFFALVASGKSLQLTCSAPASSAPPPERKGTQHRTKGDPEAPRDPETRRRRPKDGEPDGPPPDPEAPAEPPTEVPR